MARSEIPARGRIHRLPAKPRLAAATPLQLSLLGGMVQRLGPSVGQEGQAARSSRRGFLSLPLSEILLRFDALGTELGAAEQHWLPDCPQERPRSGSCIVNRALIVPDRQSRRVLGLVLRGRAAWVCLVLDIFLESTPFLPRHKMLSCVDVNCVILSTSYTHAWVL